jgi:hypothetical protein
MILLQEWNSSAIFLLFSIYLLFALIFYAFLYFVMRGFNFYVKFVNEIKQKGRFFFIFYEVIFFLIIQVVLFFLLPLFGPIL